MAHQALIADTSLLTTLVWGRFLYERSDARIEALFTEEEARAPWQRWFFTPDTPWVAGTHRDVAADAAAPETRQRFWNLLVAEAERRGLRCEIVRGGFADKQDRAVALGRALRPGQRPIGIGCV